MRNVVPDKCSWVRLRRLSDCAQRFYSRQKRLAQDSNCGLRASSGSDAECEGGLFPVQHLQPRGRSRRREVGRRLAQAASRRASLDPGLCRYSRRHLLQPGALLSPRQFVKSKLVKSGVDESQIGSRLDGEALSGVPGDRRKLLPEAAPCRHRAARHDVVADVAPRRRSTLVEQRST